MIALYLVTLAAGGAMLLFSLLGYDADDDRFDDDHHEGISEWFSLRSVTYFCAFFGATGATLTYTHATTGWTTVGLSVFVGLVVGAMSHLVITQVRRENSAGGGTVRTGDLVGTSGAVLVGFSGTESGRIKVLTTIAHTEMLCVGDGGVFNEGDVVLVTDVVGDIARVAKIE
ncbi:MAG: hypothetical protein H7Z43_07870 [Clostridia bacterium]|nr:hypothetical protein [Deltaproteobacteria bacterium]